jgi:hypothetical protein
MFFSFLFVASFCDGVTPFPKFVVEMWDVQRVHGP